jgi:hypothetical protein
MSGRISLTPPVELVDEPDQGDKILDPEAGPPTGEDEERVRTLDIGPAGRQRAHPHVAGLAEEDPVLTPRVGIPDEVELLAEQRMERVGHMESLRNAPTGCS